MAKNTITTTFQLQQETADLIHQLDIFRGDGLAKNTNLFVLYTREPILLGLDGLLRYARAYRLRHDQPIYQDSVAGDAFVDAVRGYKTLLDFDGGLAMERGITTDSKDNHTCFCLIELICQEAGFDYDEL